MLPPPLNNVGVNTNTLRFPTPSAIACRPSSIPDRLLPTVHWLHTRRQSYDTSGSYGAASRVRWLLLHRSRFTAFSRPGAPSGSVL